jgi:hypothetical protein
MRNIVSMMGVSAVNLLVAFSTSMEERERYYSFVLPRTHETSNTLKGYQKILIKRRQKSELNKMYTQFRILLKEITFQNRFIQRPFKPVVKWTKSDDKFWQLYAQLWNKSGVNSQRFIVEESMPLGMFLPWIYFSFLFWYSRHIRVYT